MTVKRALNFEHFELDKVKVTTDGLEIHYYEAGASGDIINVKCKGKEHPDLENALKALKQYFAMSLGLLKGWDFAIDKGTTKDIVAEAEKGLEAELDRCQISGITMIGKDSKTAVKITGYIKCDSGGVGLSTPPIHFDSEKIDFGEVVREMCEEVRSEIYQYYFKNKRAQLDIETEAELFEDETQTGTIFKNELS